MRKKRRIEEYRAQVATPKHMAWLSDAFGLGLPTATAPLALEGGEDNMNLALPGVDGRLVAVARHYLVTASDNVRAELEFVKFLNMHGYPTPAPLATSDGALFFSGGKDPSIALFDFVDGYHIAEWTADQLSIGGAQLAQMHMLCQAHGYRIGRTKDRESILREGLAVVARTALPDKQLFIAEVEAFLDGDLAAHAAGFAALPFGPVHHDMNPGNVFWDAEGRFVALIDFDEAHDAPYLMDLVSAMHYLTVDDDLRLQQSRCRALIGGYSDLRPLSDDEHALMQYCWDLLNIVGAMEFITANADELESALECRSFSGLFLKNRQALAGFASSG